MELRRIHDYLWEIPKSGAMRVPGRIYASAAMVAQLRDDPALQQVANVATLPGIVGYSLAMPDIHWGYGFPIGGVAAIDAEHGVISPGGVGYDINCGVRLVRTNLRYNDIAPQVERLADALFAAVPAGVGSEGAIPTLSIDQMKRILRDGVNWAAREGYARAADLDHTEENGCLKMADPDAVSEEAYRRGRKQLGTLGSGNHFLELGRVDEVYHPAAARALGLEPGQVTLIIHSGSRGLGHQTCDDYLKIVGRRMEAYGIHLPDRQLAAVPISSDEGQAYLGAMAAAANFAWCNRQLIMHLAERACLETLRLSERDLGFSLVYDVCHNIAKFEEHTVNGRSMRLCVHRKGATRAFGPGHPALPAAVRALGQPVLIPGDMGRYSFVLIGAEKAMRESFGSTCHGAGRMMSRAQAKKSARGRDLIGELAAAGVTIRYQGRGTVAEEMPSAYKDVAEVVGVMEAAGISYRVARLKPFLVVKG
ncbi:MAG TPA: RtcB family protein [Candidatus Binataceae bacterium]|nr:RtcB family protein [Candidatus Binataceae bacterium]